MYRVEISWGKTGYTGPITETKVFHLEEKPDNQVRDGMFYITGDGFEYVIPVSGLVCYNVESADGRDAD